MVAAYAKLADIHPAVGKRRVSLEITLVGRQRKTDPMAHAKSLLDSLVRCRMLIDDCAEFMEWGGVTWDRGSEGKTVIVLEDLE